MLFQCIAAATFASGLAIPGPGIVTPSLDMPGVRVTCERIEIGCLFAVYVDGDGYQGPDNRWYVPFHRIRRLGGGRFACPKRGVRTPGWIPLQ